MGDDDLRPFLCFVLRWRCALRAVVPLSIDIPRGKIIAEDSVVVGEKVGSGSFGMVHKAEYNGRPCVLKVSPTACPRSTYLPTIPSGFLIWNKGEISTTRRSR
jgi:hypothetical protein